MSRIAELQSEKNQLSKRLAELERSKIDAEAAVTEFQKQLDDSLLSGDKKSDSKIDALQKAVLRRDAFARLIDDVSTRLLPGFPARESSAREADRLDALLLVEPEYSRTRDKISGLLEAIASAIADFDSERSRISEQTDFAFGPEDFFRFEFEPGRYEKLTERLGFFPAESESYKPTAGYQPNLGAACR